MWTRFTLTLACNNQKVCITFEQSIIPYISHYIMQILNISFRNIISLIETISFLNNPLYHSEIYYIMKKHTISCINYIISEQSTISWRNLLYHGLTISFRYSLYHADSTSFYMLKHVLSCHIIYTTQPASSYLLKHQN